MKRSRSHPGAPRDSAETRDRLIAAARVLFAERGFEQVAVRDICRAAEANVAAVNYHFGDKLGLYREVARAAIEAIREVTDLAMNTQPGMSADNRLRHYVRTFLPRIAKPSDDRQWIGRLMNHEMTSPTPLASWIFAEAVMPRLLFLRDIVVELLDADPSDPRVGFCAMSVQAQCLFYKPDAFKTAVAPGWAPLTEDAAAAVAEHIVQFSLAGIQALRT